MLTSVFCAFDSYAVNEGGKVQSNRDVIDALKQIYMNLRKILVLLTHQRVLSHYPETIHKLLSTATKAVEDAKAESTVDQHAVAAASGHAVPYIESMLRKQMYNVSNSLRVLTIHLLAAVNSFQDNAYTHHIILQIGSSTKTLIEFALRVANSCETYRYAHTRTHTSQ